MAEARRMKCSSIVCPFYPVQCRVSLDVELAGTLFVC